VFVWRFSQHESPDRRGALLASARWHNRGAEILYCASNPATALLEVLVHAGVRDPSAFGARRFLKIEVPDDVPREDVPEVQLPPDWSCQVRVTRAWGDRWLRQAPTARLVVRLALVPATYNVLINPRHPDAARISRVAVLPYPFDEPLAGRL
jgi:RES domain-containing protein